MTGGFDDQPLEREAVGGRLDQLRRLGVVAHITDLFRARAAAVPLGV